VLAATAPGLQWQTQPGRTASSSGAKTYPIEHTPRSTGEAVF